jgi:hypothetical protein
MPQIFCALAAVVVVVDDAPTLVADAASIDSVSTATIKGRLRKTPVNPVISPLSHSLGGHTQYLSPKTNNYRDFSAAAAQ